MREKMSEWVLHCAVEQRHIRRSQPTRVAALKDACSQLLQGNVVNRIIGPNETINAHKIKEWCADFLNLHIPPREMLLHPILPERGLAMLLCARGIGKTLLGLSMGLAVASGGPLLRWSAPNPRRVLYIDGEMPLACLQERLIPSP
jgi:hypothetical protein